MGVMHSVIPRTISDVRGGGAIASAGPVASAPARRWDLARALRAAAAAAGLVVIVGYVCVALARIGYPGHLEILEDNSLIEVHRILAGQQLYAAPSASYVPDGYPPLYFAVSAAVASVIGQSYLPLRIVSLVASLACFAILGRLVQRETGSRAAGLAAAGLLAATYTVTDTWFDVGRVDSLFLALSVAGLYAAARARAARGAIAAGLLLGAAFCTKQTALAEGVVVLAVLAAGARRRIAVQAAVTYAVVVGGSTLILGLTSHGWYVYYVFQQMSQHALSGATALQFWFAELLPTLGLVIAAVLLAARRTPPVLLAGCGALVVEAFVARTESGSNVNDMLPAYLAVALLAGLAMGGQSLPSPAGRPRPRRFTWFTWFTRFTRFTRFTWLTRVTRSTRLMSLRLLARPAGWRRAAGRWVPVAVCALVAVQIGVLASGFRLSLAFPPSADRVAQQRLTAAARVLGGTVAIPADPGIAVAAGLPPTEDQVAAADVLRASDNPPKAIFMASLAQAVASQEYSGIITEFDRDLRGFPADLPLYYYRCPQSPLDGALSVPFSANAQAVPVSVWLPIGRQPSCAAVARALES
jgi:Dolichyl-phosphate-mannose-protein mannosyltransferase